MKMPFFKTFFSFIIHININNFIDRINQILLGYMLNQLDQKYNVIIGSKPIMNYIVASITLFNQGAKKIVIRARGRHISKAVDTTELLRRVFLKDIIIEDITIDTDVLQRKDGIKANISSIQIYILSKKN